MLGFTALSEQPISSLPSSGPVAYTLACDVGAYAYAGKDATLTYVPGATGINYTLACDAGAYVYAGQDATLTVARRLPLDAGAYAYAGQDATLTYTPGAGAVAYTLACDTGSYAISGGDAVLTWSGAQQFRMGGVPNISSLPRRETEEQKRTRRIAQGIIRDAQKPAADLEKLSRKAASVSQQLRADVAFYEAKAARYAQEIAQSKQAIALVMQARNDALATRQLEQRMIQAQLQAEAAAQQVEELDVVFMAVMLAAME